MRERDSKGRYIPQPPPAPVPLIEVLADAAPVVEVVSVDDVYQAPEVPMTDVRGLVAAAADQTEFDVWDEETVVVLKESMNIGHKTSGRWYLMGYNDATANPGNTLCNRIDGSGMSICRLKRDHAPEPHLPFHVALVVQSGIYVEQVGPDPASPRPPVKEESPTHDN